MLFYVCVFHILYSFLDIFPLFFGRILVSSAAPSSALFSGPECGQGVCVSNVLNADLADVARHLSPLFILCLWKTLESPVFPFKVRKQAFFLMQIGGVVGLESVPDSSDCKYNIKVYDNYNIIYIIS